MFPHKFLIVSMLALTAVPSAAQDGTPPPSLLTSSGSVALSQNASAVTPLAEAEHTLKSLRSHFPDKTDEQIIRTLQSFASRDERPEKDSIRWFAARLERTRRQRQAIDALEKLGWLFSYDDGFDAGNNRAPDRLRERLGKVFFNDVVSADHKADDPGWPPPAKDLHLALEQLAKLPRLRQLNLSRSKITDTGMAYLEAMPQLDSIYLEETEITDAGLKSLAGLHRLAFLDLQSNRITDAGLASLGGLTELETLGLSLTQVSDAGLVHLKSLHKLQKLYLAGCHITNAGLEHLEAFDDLQTLALGGTSITAAGLAHLKGLHNSGTWNSYRPK